MENRSQGIADEIWSFTILHFPPLVKDDYQKGTDIRLISCYTGSKEDGVAQYIANKLGVTVWAPNKLGIINRFAGRYRVYSGSDYGIEDGRFIPFTPNEGKEEE